MSSSIIRRALAPVVLLAASATVSAPAFADDAPYSLPWQLRPAAAATAVRADATFAGYDNAKGASGGFTVAPTLVASYKVPGTGDGWTGLAPLLKLAAVNDSPPAGGTGGFAIVNPLVGATYAMALPAGVRAGFFLGATIPIGMGGGDTPSAGVTDARSAGQYARSQMDDSLFAVDDFALIPGVDVAWVGSGFTVQAEATLFQLWRVRGSGINPATMSAPDPDATKTNFTSGIHVGYFVIPLLSFGVDVRYQRWLSPPLAIQKAPSDYIDNWTGAIGPRLHIPLGEGIRIHPGLAFAMGLDNPMGSPFNYRIVQLDVPVTF